MGWNKSQIHIGLLQDISSLLQTTNAPFLKYSKRIGLQPNLNKLHLDMNSIARTKLNSSTLTKFSKQNAPPNYSISSSMLFRAYLTTVNWIQALLTNRIILGTKLAWITTNNKIIKFTTNFIWVNKFVRIIPKSNKITTPRPNKKSTITKSSVAIQNRNLKFYTCHP